MEIQTRIEGDVLVVSLAGELDAYWSAEVRDALLGRLEKGAYRQVLDLGGLEYLSSAGLRVLLQLQNRINTYQGVLGLAAPQPFVQEVLSSSGFSRALKLFDTVDEAVAALRTPEGATADDGWAAAQDRTTATGSYQFRRGESGFGRVRVHGDPGDLLFCRADSTRLSSVPLNEQTVAFGVGSLGALQPGGESAVLDRLGELVAVPRAAYWQPGDGRRVPDYLIAEDGQAQLQMHLLYGLALEGPQRASLRFTAGDPQGGAELSELARDLLDWGSRQTDFAGGVGFCLRAELGGAWGVALKRAPRAGRAPADGAKISHRENIKDWLHFPTEAEHADQTLLAVGLLLDVKRTALSPEKLDRAFGVSQVETQRDMYLHAHGAVFRAVPELGGDKTIAEEMGHLVRHGEPLSVLHLLPRTRLRKARIGVWMLGEMG